MSKKIFLIILIPALLLIGGYAALQLWLRTSSNDTSDKQRTEHTAVQQTNAKAKTIAEKQSETNQPAKTPQRTDRIKASSPVPVSSKEKKDDNAKKEAPLDLRPLFIEKMQQLVKKSSNGLYDLSVGELEVDVLASTVLLHNVSLRPDKNTQQQLQRAGQLPGSVLSASFDDLLIEGIHLDDAINSKSMDYKLVKLVNPVIEIEQYNSGEEKSSSGGDFSQRFLQEMEKLAISQVEVEGGRITVHDKPKKKTNKLQQVRIRLQDILINDKTRNDKDRFLFARDAQLEFHDFTTQTSDGLYDIKIGDAFVNATKKSVELKNLSFGSPLSKEEFVARQTEAKEKYDIRLPSVVMNDINWWPALNGDGINAGEMVVQGGELAIYLDRSLPPKNKMGNFPNQLLAKVPLDVNINKIRVSDLAIAYEEKSARTGQRATIHFDSASIAIGGVNNKAKNKEPVTIDATALFMKKVPMKANLELLMEKPEEGRFSADVEVDSFDARLLNSFSKPLGLITIENGKVESLKATLQGNEHRASGTALLLYDDLRIAIWKKKEGEQELRKRPLFSFLANVFAIKNNNPWWLSGNVRSKEPQFERQVDEGFIALIWKTLFTGIVKTLGAPESAAKGKK